MTYGKDTSSASSGASDEQMRMQREIPSLSADELDAIDTRAKVPASCRCPVPGNCAWPVCFEGPDFDPQTVRRLVAQARLSLGQAEPSKAANDTTRYPVGLHCTVPECVFAVDSVKPVPAIVQEVHADLRYVVRARGEDLWVTHSEITPATPAQARLAPGREKGDQS